jgi:hypothetical protein
MSDRQDPAQDSEIDFDDESPSEFMVIDELEAEEAGVNLDDPEELAVEDVEE